MRLLSRHGIDHAAIVHLSSYAPSGNHPVWPSPRPPAYQATKGPGAPQRSDMAQSSELTVYGRCLWVTNQGDAAGGASQARPSHWDDQVSRLRLVMGLKDSHRQDCRSLQMRRFCLCSPPGLDHRDLALLGVIFRGGRSLQHVQCCVQSPGHGPIPRQHMRLEQEKSAKQKTCVPVCATGTQAEESKPGAKGATRLRSALTLDD